MKDGDETVFFRELKGNKGTSKLTSDSEDEFKDVQEELTKSEDDEKTEKFPTEPSTSKSDSKNNFENFKKPDNPKESSKQFPSNITYRRKDKTNLDYLKSISDWSVHSKKMAQMEMRDIVKLIPEYDGKEKTLDTFIKKIDKLWGYIADNDDADKNQLLLVLQLKLVGKAAEAVQDNEFVNWQSVKEALINKITPHRNTEKSELKLCATKQKPGESIEDYAQRIEDALSTLNRSFPQEEQNEAIKKVNDRKAKTSFENGLFSTFLKNQVIGQNCTTFRNSVDYVIEQDLRRAETRPKNNNLFCSFCKMTNHSVENCRRKNQNNYSRNTNEKEIICYKCGKKNHYANECRSNAEAGPSKPRENNFRSDNNSQQKRNVRMNKTNTDTCDQNARDPNKNVESCTQTEETTLIENISKN